MQGITVAQTLRSRKDGAADEEGQLATKASMANMKKVNSMKQLLDDIGEDNPGSPGGKRLTVKGASSATSGAIDASTFDLNKDGEVDEEEMERIRRTAHLSNPEQVVVEARAIVQEHIERKGSYLSLLRFLAYFVLYIVVLLGLQGDTTNMYKMQKSIQNAFLPREQYVSKRDFLQWLQTKVLWNSFIDPVCGNGLCEGPVEFPAFGDAQIPAHGCLADCGRFPNTTQYVVQIQPHFSAEVSATDKFAWNLCSDDLGLCYYKEAVPFDLSSNVSVVRTLNLLDGLWHVHLEGSLVLSGSSGIYVSGDIFNRTFEVQQINCSAANINHTVDMLATEIEPEQQMYFCTHQDCLSLMTVEAFPSQKALSWVFNICLIRFTLFHTVHRNPLVRHTTIRFTQHVRTISGF